MLASPRAAFLSCAVLVPLGLVGAQRDWRVAQDGTGDFTEIVAAVQAASDGDTIRIERGRYAPFVIDGKSLTLIAPQVFQAGFQPGGAPSMVVRNLAVDQHVHLIDAFAFQSQTPLANVLLEDCAGPVWIDGMFSDSYGATAVRIDRCADVVMAHCRLQTNTGRTDAQGIVEPQPGLWCRDSAVRLIDCVLFGSRSVLQGPRFPTASGPVPGGHGIEVIDSDLAVQGSEIQGGTGSGLTSGRCVFSGPGGDGLRLSTQGGTLPRATVLDSDLLGGAPGAFTCGSAAASGRPIHVQAGTAQSLPGTARVLEADGLVTTPGALRCSLAGEAGDTAWVLAGVPSPTLPFLGFTLHLTSPDVVLGRAVYDAGGRGTLEVALPPLPGIAPTLALQAFVVDTSGGLWGTDPESLVLR